MFCPETARFWRCIGKEIRAKKPLKTVDAFSTARPREISKTSESRAARSRKRASSSPWQRSREERFCQYPWRFPCIYRFCNGCSNSRHRNSNNNGYRNNSNFCRSNSRHSNSSLCCSNSRHRNSNFCRSNSHHRNSSLRCHGFCHNKRYLRMRCRFRNGHFSLRTW